jgi:predicted phosphodiesterase
MNFDLISDIHLSSPYDLGNSFFKSAKSDTLVIAGDLCEARQCYKLRNVFERFSKSWKNVIYIMGNHEFYDGSLSQTVYFMKRFFHSWKNIKVLDNEKITIDEITFVTSTLWSDFNNGNPISMIQCQNGINDFHYIFPKIDFRVKNVAPITTMDILTLFKKNKEYLTNEINNLKDCENLVVITHHAPSYSSIDEKYLNHPANGAFVSNLDDLILDSPQIKCWAHGHTHTNLNYKIGDCKIICNPRGYRNELYGPYDDYFPLTIEL